MDSITLRLITGYTESTDAEGRNAYYKDNVMTRSPEHIYGRSSYVVVVLTVRLDGGGMREALDMLGFRPYSLRDAVLYPRTFTHPREWVAVLREGKTFDPTLLDGVAGERPLVPKRQIVRKFTVKALRAWQRYRGVETRVKAGDVMSEWTPYDALVGPPATAAFEAVLRACPRSTRVIFVAEEECELTRQMEHVIIPLLNQMQRIASVPFVGMINTMLQAMFELRNKASLQSPQTSSVTLEGSGVNKIITQQIGHPAFLADMRQATMAWQLFEMHVKEVVPADRLLIYRPSQGWSPLCTFLQEHLSSMSGPASGVCSHVSAQLPATVPCSDGSEFALLLCTLARITYRLMQARGILAKMQSTLVVDNKTASVSTAMFSMNTMVARMFKLAIQGAGGKDSSDNAQAYPSLLAPQLHRVRKECSTTPPQDN